MGGGEVVSSVSPSGVGDIGDGLTHVEEVWGDVHIPHCQVEVEDGEGFHVVWERQNNKGEAVYVLRADPDTHVCIGDVNLGEEDRSKFCTLS